MKKQPSTFGDLLHRFWFRPVSAAGFGMMRIAWAVTTFILFAAQAPAVQRFYGPDGILPHAMIPDVLRQSHRFSLLDAASPQMAWILYLLLLATLACVALGIMTRVALLISVVLLYSFHEYGIITLDGGDTLLRLIGFLLVISPSDRTFTLANFFRRRRMIAAHGKDQPVSARTMPIWPYRLLLWQMICLYVSSSIGKLYGTTWLSGSAVAIALHHGHFQRWPTVMVDALSYLSPAIGYFTLFMQLGWILLIILPVLAWFGLRIPGRDAVKRGLMLCGVFIHVGIFLLMDVGTFSFAVLTAYLGLLLDDDFRAIRSVLNSKTKKPVVVLYDGRCGFCKAAIFVLSIMDWLHRLEFHNYHDAKVRGRYASTVPFSDLNEEMHAVLPAHRSLGEGGPSGKIVKGFFAFRAMASHIPVLWPLAPFLYIPGVGLIGEFVYRYIAFHRPRVA